MQLELPKGAHEAWLATPLSADRFDDWFEDDDFLGGSSPGLHATVRDLFGALERLSGEPVTTFLESDPGSRVPVYGCLHVDEASERFRQDLATAARVALDHGARGKAYVLPLGLEGGYLITLGKKKSKLSVVPFEEAFGDDDVADRMLGMNDWLAARQADQALTRAAYRAGEARFWLPEAPAPAEAAVAAALAGLGEAAVTKAIAAAGEPSPPLRAVKRPASASELAAALSAGDPNARIQAPGLLAAADFATAEPLLLPLLEQESPLLRIAAARALAPTRDPATLAAVLGAVRMGRVMSGLRGVVEGAHKKTLDAFLRSTLDGPLFDPRNYTALAPTGCGASAAELEAAEVLSRRAEIVAELVADRELKEALPMFERLLTDTDPLSIPLKRLSIRPVLVLGGKKAEKKYAERIQWLSMNMGLALNQNVARRAEILRLDAKTSAKDYAKFDELDLDRLRQLLGEGFIGLDAAQNDAPATADFLAFMEAWPEVTAHGYAIGIGRGDYRTMIEGVACDLTEVAAERREPLRAAFEELCASATQLEAEGDALSAWWT